jgi:hypothetical protein
MNLVDLYASLAPCVTQVVAEKYPQLGGAVLEVIGGARAASYLIGLFRGESAPATGGVFGKVLSALNVLGLNRK